MSQFRRLAFVPIFAVLLFGYSGAAPAAVFSLGAILTGDQEVPAVMTDANGLATLVYDTDANTFDLTVLVSGIELVDVLAFHIHGPAPVGENANVIVDLGALGDFNAFPVSGGLLSFQLTDAPFPDTFESDLLNGLTYLNLHTVAHQAGEIRGQLVPEPATAVLLLGGLGLLGVAGAGRRV